ncbi:MAG: AAA family ATPase, partial [Proteobacteria bacterium]|nr:AAA family ATPase [Pseudomonadota bacterium]
MLTGEIGVGKSALTQYFLDNLESDYTAGLLNATKLTADNFISGLLEAYNQSLTGDIKQLTKSFSQFVSAEKSKNNHPVLIIDDCHKLPVEVLNILYVIIKELSDTGRTITTLLVGEPALSEKLAQSNLEHLSKSIDTDCVLGPLSKGETIAYIHYQNKVAGVAPGLFDDGACKEIYKHTEGTPRSVNLLCDSVLVYGFLDESKTITEKIVDQVVTDRKEGKLLPNLVRAEEIARERIQQTEEAEKLKIEEENRIKQAEELKKAKQKGEETRIDEEKKASRLKLEEEEIQFKAGQEQTRLKKLQEEQEAKRIKEEQEIKRKEMEAKRLKEEKEAQIKADLEAAKLKAKMSLGRRSTDTGSLLGDVPAEVSTMKQSGSGAEQVSKAGEKERNFKPAIGLALVIIVAFTGYLFFSDDSQSISPKILVSENDDLKKEQDIKERAAALKARQKEQEQKAAELATKRAEEKAREAALKARQEEKRKKAAAAVVKARQERERAAAMKAKREKAARKKKAQEVAKNKALEEAVRKKAEEDALILKEQELAKQKQTSIEQRAAELKEKKRIEAYR